MRFSIWIPRTPVGLLASILAGLAIAAVLWFGLFGAPSFNAPRGTEANFRDEEALVITMIATLAGGSWIGTRLDRLRLSPQIRLQSPFKKSADPSLADLVRRTAWFADSVIDLDAARRRARLDGHVVLGSSYLDLPNPFTVLPAEAIVKWGFATASQVASAYMMAGNGTAPAMWHDPALMRDLGYMGWDSTESVARIGLLKAFQEQPYRTKRD